MFILVRKMNKLELKKFRNKIQRKYHIPGQSNLYPRKRNAVFISASNSLEHEKAKLEVCWHLRKLGRDFITEAVCNKTGLRRDAVCLDSGTVFEVETDKRRAARFDGEDVVVIPLWKSVDIEMFIND